MKTIPRRKGEDLMVAHRLEKEEDRWSDLTKFIKELVDVLLEWRQVHHAHHRPQRLSARWQ